MALYTAEAVRANVRNKEGRRVFYLSKEDRLTPGAKDYLRDNHIEIIPAENAFSGSYRTERGAVFTQKPEDMTHLNGEILVPKTHPRIAFRGQMDTLEGELLLAMKAAAEQPEIYRDLEQCLELVRKILACDVLEEPLGDIHLGGLTEQELRDRSHHPQRYYDQPHFMPDGKDSWSLLLVNKARTTARQGELALCHGFKDEVGQCTREDLLKAMNRLSSFLWILEIRLRAEKREHHGKYTGGSSDSAAFY